MSGKAEVDEKKENVLIKTVLLEAGSCSIAVLPQFGGKIASIQFQNCELLQPPLAPIAPRTHTMSFDAADASGWDECLPSVASCTVAYNGADAAVPDHGDLWRVEWEDESSTGGQQPKTSLTLKAACFSLPLEVERTLSLAETTTGVRLSLHYAVTNTGDAPAPWSWAAHPLFLVEEGDRIVLPESIQTLRVEGSGYNRLGKNGDTVNWPIAKLAAGGETDLSRALPPGSGVGDKLFAGPLRASESWCELVRPKANVKIRVSLDTAATPYLGLWICYGGWPSRVGPKQTCVALEPATAPVDSLAETGPWSRHLAPGQQAEWSMQVDFETL